VTPVPYCGASPVPGGLLERFNLDPVLIGVLLAFCLWQWTALKKDPSRFYSLGGWLIAAAAFLSPLCALSVALFSARVAQHMVLVLAAAPLIALGLPRVRPHASSQCPASSRSAANSNWSLWASTTTFFVALWIWHMPVPYEATFTSVAWYWAMHLTLFGSGIFLWRELLQHPPERTVAALAAGAFTFVQMGLLGAILAFAGHPMFRWHLSTALAWGFTPLQDQQLGGVFMWVPGVALFLWTGVRSVSRLWHSLERARPA
jgi:putative membrane protein